MTDLHSAALWDDAAPMPLGAQALLLPGQARDYAPQLLQDIAHITAQAPWRHMHTPGGQRMQIATSGCGALSWISDALGYRYAARDPLTGQPWPAMPTALLQLARQAAAQAGFAGFAPDACLINRYAPGTRLSLHQDRDEQDFSAPIVSVSLGLPAVFLWGGLERRQRPQQLALQHGDVLVWGGVDRLRFHGVQPVADGLHPLTGRWRINLTLRQAR